MIQKEATQMNPILNTYVRQPLSTTTIDNEQSDSRILFARSLIECLPSQQRQLGWNSAQERSIGSNDNLSQRSQRVVAVSNRGLSDVQAAAGGLAVALSEALSSEESLWFGWSGKLSQQPNQVKLSQQKDPCQRIQIDLTPGDYQPFYNGYCNSTLWPVLSNCSKWADFSPAYYRAYLKVNRTFAHHLAPLLANNDIIWIHDYHLIPLAAALRQQGCNQRIGFFLHTPFPPPQTFRVIQEHSHLAKHWMAYDLIGMQTARDIDHFKTYLQQTLPVCISDERTLQYLQRKITLQHFPIGIDVTRLRTLQPDQASYSLIHYIRQQASQRTLMVGIDRLDYAKGIPRKIKAFRQLIGQNPSLHRTISLVQIAAPSRDTLETYQRLGKKTKQLVEATNQQYGDDEWTPVIYLNQTVNRSALPSIYGQSQVCVVSSVADGMNLVAKEYLACQDPKDPGVLVISHESGAAEQLKEAIIFPAKSRESLTNAYRQALDLPLDERKKRHAALTKNIETEDLHQWCKRYLNALRQV